MPYDDFPTFIRGLYFPDDKTHHRFLNDMDAGLCDPDELETWLCWPRDPAPGEPVVVPTPSPEDDHEIMTAEEACRYLRLDIGRSMPLALKALNRLVDKGLIRPCLVGKHRRYTRDELQRFIGATTARYGDCR